MDMLITLLSIAVIAGGSWYCGDRLRDFWNNDQYNPRSLARMRERAERAEALLAGYQKRTDQAEAMLGELQERIRRVKDSIGCP